MILYLPRWLWIGTLSLIAFYWYNPSWKTDAVYLTQAAMTLASAILFARRGSLILAAGLVSTLFADVSYYIQIYKLKLGANSLRAYLTTSLPYTLGFALISGSLYNQVKRGTNLFRAFKISMLPVLILFGATVSMIFAPMLTVLRQGNVQYHEIGALTELSMSLPLIIVAYLAAMLAFELSEACLAIGALLMGLVDWVIQLEYVTAGKLGFSYLDFFWFFGLLLIFTRSVDPRPLREYVFFKGQSLRVQLKILTLLCSLLPIGAYFTLDQGNLKLAIGFFLIGTAVSLFVASIVVEYFSRQLTGLTHEIQQIFDSTSTELEAKPASALSEEWGESLKIILRNKLWQDKMKADQERWLLEKRNEISAQVSHDIRSPLTALNVAVSDIGGVAEPHRILIKNAVARINDIANTLLLEKRRNAIESSVVLLSPLIDSLVSEKRMQFREMQSVEIEAGLANAYGNFISADLVELKRAVSNLITNAVEALPEGVGRVAVTVRGAEGEVHLSIADNGKGIPRNILDKVGQPGFSFGKAGTGSGSGLGIHHARKTVQSAGGVLEIDSSEGKGTTVTLIFKKAPTPKWFVERLVLRKRQVVCSIDDDTSIHQLWRGRLDKLGLPYLTFTSIRDFQMWFESGNGVGLFLFDHEFLGQKRTGLDVIEELAIANQSVLVTSRYEERDVRERCDRLQVPLIPKAMAGYVPITIEA